MQMNRNYFWHIFFDGRSKRILFETHSNSTRATEKYKFHKKLNLEKVNYNFLHNFFYNAKDKLKVLKTWLINSNKTIQLSGAKLKYYIWYFQHILIKINTIYTLKYVEMLFN